MIACLDVDYRDAGATAACLLFQDWSDEQSIEEIVIPIDRVEPYEPGQFYRRELPCLRAVLAAVRTKPRIRSSSTVTSGSGMNMTRDSGPISSRRWAGKQPSSASPRRSSWAPAWSRKSDGARARILCIFRRLAWSLPRQRVGFGRCTDRSGSRPSFEGSISCAVGGCCPVVDR